MIYDKFTVKKGAEKFSVVLRDPEMEDVDDMLEFINSLTEEDVDISTTKKYTRQEEKKYLRDLLRRIERGSMLSVVVEVNGKVVGNSSVTRRKEETDSHVAELGIAISKDYRNFGIGKRLMDALIKTAKRKWKTKVVKLSCYETNKHAQHVYRKLGFRKTGRIPKGIKHGGKYIDHIIMAKVL